MVIAIWLGLFGGVWCSVYAKPEVSGHSDCFHRLPGVGLAILHRTETQR